MHGISGKMTKFTPAKIRLPKPKAMIIQSATFVMSNTDPAKCPPGDRPEYAFIGRSNVGKSSLINMLTARRIAMTSQTPGKTLLINHFNINDEWYLVDLPGYGYAKRGKQTLRQIGDIIRAYIMRRTSLTSLFVLIDSRLTPQRIDLDFIQWLGENGVPFAIIFTKADKLSKTKVAANVQAFLDTLSEQWEELPPHFISSSEDRTGRDKILGYIDEINRIVKQ